MNMDTLIKFNDQLIGAPAGVLVMLFACALGYVLKSVAAFPNRWIPAVVVGFTTLVFVLIMPERGADMPGRVYYGRGVIIGFLFGFAAWAFHAQVLKRWLDPKIFSSNTNQNQK